MELYGVQHGHQTELAGIPITKIQGMPSEEMLERIRELPEGSLVGIETTPEVLSGIEDEGMYFSADQAAYWQAIVDACEERSHEIVFLDDFGIHKEIGRMLIAAKKLAMGLKKEIQNLSPEVIREIRELIFALETMAEYKHFIKRERAIFEKMAVLDLDVAMIGITHGDFLALYPEFTQAKIEEYWRGVYDDFPNDLVRASLLMEYPEVHSHQRLEKSAPSLSQLKEREALQRTLNAVTKGRIVFDVDQEPTWTGSWRPECRAEGLFEVYPDMGEDGTISGIIEDNLGTATFEGTFSEAEICFTKTYITNKVLSPAAFKAPLLFRAQRANGDEYRGEYGIQNFGGNFEVYGKFVIKKDTGLYKPIDVENLDISGLLK